MPRRTPGVRRTCRSYCRFRVVRSSFGRGVRPGDLPHRIRPGIPMREKSQTRQLPGAEVLWKECRWRKQRDPKFQCAKLRCRKTRDFPAHIRPGGGHRLHRKPDSGRRLDLFRARPPVGTAAPDARVEGRVGRRCSSHGPGRRRAQGHRAAHGRRGHPVRRRRPGMFEKQSGLQARPRMRRRQGRRFRNIRRRGDATR